VTRILAFGDSLTEGLATPGAAPMDASSLPGVPQSFPFKLQQLLTGRYAGQTLYVINAGVGGERAADARARFTATLDLDSPDAVVLLEGANDLLANLSPDATAGALKALIDDASARHVRVMLVTLPPERAGGSRAGAVDRVKPLNALLARLAASEGATLVDFSPLVTDAMIAPDGLHLTEIGNAQLAYAVFDAIRAAWEAPTSTRASAESRRRACPATRDTCGPAARPAGRE
jgi:lysophospholipase L1-like esterase